MYPCFVVPIVPQSHNGKNFFKQFLDPEPNPDDFQSDFLVQRYVSGVNEDPVSIYRAYFIYEVVKKQINELL